MSRAASVRVLRALLVAGAAAAYLGYVFRIGSGQFATSALGDWMDPYFINGLLEHWAHSVRTLADPASPPIFFPVRGALGYSHGLALYAPFYVPLRLFLHPFQAYNLTVFLAALTGIVCLYALLRRLGASAVESFALTALFATSENVVNGMTGVWAQRASVFLIPPIMLMALAAVSSGRTPLAFLAGALAVLMYVQDFYTAHFAMLFAACALVSVAIVEWRGSIARTARGIWEAQPRSMRPWLFVAVVAMTAAVWILLTGGGQTRIAGVRLMARDWRRPALAAAVVFAAAVWKARTIREVTQPVAWLRTSPWALALLSGAAAGAAAFLWTYGAAYNEHSAFPKAEIWGQLASGDPFLSSRTFVLAAVMTILAWLPWLRVERRARQYVLCLAVVSAAVMIAPRKFDDHSLWTYVGRLPGFGVIRDPKRIIYLYELAAVVAAAAVLARSGSRVFRAAATTAAFALTIALPNRQQFDYERTDAVFDRWIAAPIAVDPSCRSFYMKSASADYMARSPHAGTLYGNDALFLALRLSLPTLNGYSAWSPDGWELWNPPESSYLPRVAAWVRANGLTGVCELDIDARTVAPPR